MSASKLMSFPAPNHPVTAIIKHFDSFNTMVVSLVFVNEPDTEWRYKSDNCELANEWNVIYWERNDD